MQCPTDVGRDIDIKTWKQLLVILFSISLL